MMNEKVCRCGLKPMFCHGRNAAKYCDGPPLDSVERLNYERALVVLNNIANCVEPDPTCATDLFLLAIGKREREESMGDNLICEDCQTQDDTVIRTMDPYALEIYLEEIPMNLCPDCEHQRAMDI